MKVVKKRAPYSYNKGPYRWKDVPGLLVGAAAIGGGILVIVRALLEKKQDQTSREAKITLQGGRGSYR